VRWSVARFAEDVATHFPIAEPLVEMGARVAAGQEDAADIRGIFHAKQHIGCDIQDGLGVDRIEDIHHLSFETGSVGTVVALETLEHVADPIRAVEEMHRVLRPGGILAISSLMFFPIHDHPWDYWRFTPEAFELLLKPFETSWVVYQGHPTLPEGIFGVGCKGPMDGTADDLLPQTVSIAWNWGKGMLVDLGPIKMTVRDAWKHTLRGTVLAGRRRLHRLPPDPPQPPGYASSTRRSAP
jgi:SAM-dependent methyltransferase